MGRNNTTVFSRSPVPHFFFFSQLVSSMKHISKTWHTHTRVKHAEGWPPETALRCSAPSSHWPLLLLNFNLGNLCPFVLVQRVKSAANDHIFTAIEVWSKEQTVCFNYLFFSPSIRVAHILKQDLLMGNISYTFCTWGIAAVKMVNICSASSNDGKPIQLPS